MNAAAPQTTPVVTRFAPSPTGFLHIGGARTALFNWLYARGRGGKFLLRIEDTDRARHTPEATQAILDGLRWLGLDWDGDVVSQYERHPRHQEAAAQMLANGSAYKCWSTKEEIDAYREAAKAEGRPPMFPSPWRDNPDGPADQSFVVRLRAPREGQITVNDAVQGDVTWDSKQLDDLILLRSDGSPTYMLAVVVDDHDMGVTHVIRGDDHLTNAARQTLIYRGLGFDVPVFSHIPLIHGPDGAKLSKRHGALGVEAYRDMGYLPEALRNYLARLGWSHGDDEFFTDAEALEWFDLDGINKGAARFDFDKLAHLSGQHMRAADPARLSDAAAALFASQHDEPIEGARARMLREAMPGLRDRAKTLLELLDLSYYILCDGPLQFDAKAAKLINDDTREMLVKLTSHLRDATAWDAETLEGLVREFSENEGLKLGKVAQPLRAALTGRAVSPGVFDVAATLGRDISMARLEAAAAPAA